MERPETVLVYSADQADPIELEYSVHTHTARRRDLPFVTYTVARRASEKPNRIALFLPGGGSSGVLFARAAELCAEQGIQVHMLDLPGHTPDRMIETQSNGLTPGRSWIRHLDFGTRMAVIRSAIERLRPLSQSGKIDVVTHSAGFLDASRIHARYRDSIRKFFILGAGIPGPDAMRSAYAAANDAQSASEHGLLEILRTRSINTGEVSIHFGPEAMRSTPEEILGSYQGADHYSLVLRLLIPRAFGLEIWRDAEVEIIGSSGDRIAPPKRSHGAAVRLRELGARAEVSILGGDFPHMFMAFEPGARFVADRICQ